MPEPWQLPAAPRVALYWINCQRSAFTKSFERVLFGLLIHPSVLAKSSLNEDLLAFLGHFGKVFGGDAPELNINERGCCALLVTNCVRLIYAKRNVGDRRALRGTLKFRILD